MKKIISIIFMLVMFACAGVTAFGLSEDVPEYVRIGISTGGSSYAATFTNGFCVYEYDDGAISRVKSFSDVNSIQIVNDGTYVNVYNSSDLSTPIYSYDNQSEFFVGCSDMKTGTMTLGGTTYRGGVKLYKSSDGNFRVINVLLLEKYLYGVVSKEMSSSYPLEALKAQAVAARSYALGNIGRHKSLGYDICNTQCCQVYGGVSGEVAKCSSAVDATLGVIAYYDGKPISCYYSANNGGYIESSKDIWGSDVGYLQAKKDEYTPDYNWSAKFTSSELTALLKTAGYNVGTITDINILSKTEGGSVTKLEINGTYGSAVLDKSNIKSVLGSSVIKSLKFTISYNGSDSGSIDTTSGTKYYVKGVSGSATQTILTGLAMFDKDGNTVTINSSAVTAQSSANVVTLSGVISGATSTTTAKTGEFVFNGKGYGHCIGMSQQGAKVMAESGFTYDDILKYYFIGITVE